MYKHAEASFWTAEEMDLSKDLHNGIISSTITNATSSPMFLPSLLHPMASSTRTTLLQ
jgi:hypothetical protein